jgi:hypothetical protein
MEGVVKTVKEERLEEKGFAPFFLAVYIPSFSPKQQAVQGGLNLSF